MFWNDNWGMVEWKQTNTNSTHDTITNEWNEIGGKEGRKKERKERMNLYIDVYLN